MTKTKTKTKTMSVIVAALCVFGLAAGSMAADTGALAAPSTHKHQSTHKSAHKLSHSKKSKKTASAAK